MNPAALDHWQPEAPSCVPWLAGPAELGHQTPVWGGSLQRLHESQHLPGKSWCGRTLSPQTRPRGLWFVHDPVTAPMAVLWQESLFQMAVGQPGCSGHPGVNRSRPRVGGQVTVVMLEDPGGGWTLGTSHHAGVSHARRDCHVAPGFSALYWWGAVQALACCTSGGRQPQAPQDLS